MGAEVPCIYADGGEWSGGRCGGGSELAELSWFGNVQGAEDACLGGGGGGAALDGAGRAGEGAEVHLVELVAEVPPGVAGSGFSDADE